MKNAIVTGANIGLGLETVKGLLQEGFHVTMACRNEEKTSSAITKLKKEYPSSKIDFMKLDLNDLSSVKSFAENFAKSNPKLDLLVNNAGIMMPPFSLTANGFESQLGVNYLSHFALTGLLFDLLKKSEDARVISLASLAHKWGDIYFQDLNFKGKYNKKKAYGQSKLACLMFAYEFDRRLKEKNIKILSVAAHPGVSSTNLGQFMPKFMSFGMGLISQSATDGARPTLYAALNTELVGGEYIGPNGLGEMKGEPTKVDSNKASKNLVVAKKLWECDLPMEDQMELTREIDFLSKSLKELGYDKVNIGSLGNIVSQLHIHVIGRRKSDRAWPAPIWGTQSLEEFSQARVEFWKEKI